MGSRACKQPPNNAYEAPRLVDALTPGKFPCNVLKYLVGAPLNVVATSSKIESVSTRDEVAETEGYLLAPIRRDPWDLYAHKAIIFRSSNLHTLAKVVFQYF